MKMRLWLSAGWSRLLVTGLCLVTWRLLEQVTVVGLTPGAMLYNLGLQSLDTSTFFHAIGINSIPLASYSIVVMGVQPYVNALILMTVFAVISKGLGKMWTRPDGRLAIRRWARALTVFFAAGQAYGYTVLWQFDSSLAPMDWSARLLVILQLTTGTMILMLLGDVLDEFGLGFGNGAILIYALIPLATELHRLASIIAAGPSLEALYKPLAVWIVFSIAVAMATVAVLLAVRRIPPRKTKRPTRTTPTELRILMSGVLRPPVFAQSVQFLPALAANYLATTHPEAVQWINDHATAYGPNPWTDIGYAAINACLVILFTQFVVACDFRVTAADAAWHINRLAFIGGTFLAIMVVVVPMVEWNVSGIAGRVIGMSGFYIVLVVAMIVVIVDRLEHYGKHAAGRAPILMSRMP
jgi:preprotein translocase subunit SecY